MPDQYDWGLWPSRVVLPHSHVYRRVRTLQGGTTYHFQTRNLQRLTSANPDPVMYLVRGNDIVAFNDDYTGLASEIIYTPTDTDSYRLIIRAYSTATPGVCDVYEGAGGAQPTQLDSNVYFGGTYVSVRWKQGEWFETGVGTLYFSAGIGSSGSASDPYLFLIYPDRTVGGKMYWDDDGAGSLQSKIVPPDGGTGVVILGSYARYTDGDCRLALVGQSYKAPWMSPAPWASVPEPAAPTPSAAKYTKELQRQKRSLSKLSQDERDQRVLALQRELLPEEEVRRQLPHRRAVDPELVRRQKIFLEGWSEMEKDLDEVAYDERGAKLAHLKREALGMEYSEPETLPPPRAEGGGRTA